jgi:molybdate/tungstate transport system permease protein
MTLMRVALATLLLLVAAPLVNLVFSVPGAELLAALSAPGTWQALQTSGLASLYAISVASLLGIPAGYVLARSRGLWRTLALLALTLPLALPPVASGIALLGLLGTRRPVGAFLQAHGLGVVDTLAGVGIAEFFVAGSVVAIAATAAFSGVDRRLEEAARTLGAGPLRVVRTISIPLAAPGIAAGIMLAWLRAIGEYGATSLLAYHPTSLPIELVVALSADGVPRALALAEAFALLAAGAVIVAALVRRRLA